MLSKEQRVYQNLVLRELEVIENHPMDHFKILFKAYSEVG